jgi:hypothetical protein
VELSEQQQFFEGLDALREKGETLQRENAATLQEVLDGLQVPEQGAVSAAFDEEGLISTLAITDGAKGDLSTDQLVQEINLAVVRASPPIGRNASPTVLTNLMDALSSGGTPELVDVTNDFGSVTISARWGIIAEVKCSATWIQSTPESLISEEIVRMGRIAARETDTLGRFPK